MLDSQTPMIIGGRTVMTASSYAVVNPATGLPLAYAAECTRADLDAAVVSAQAAFSGWRRAEAERRRALILCAQVLSDESENLAQLLTAEQGKPIHEARNEVALAVRTLRLTSELSLPSETLRDDPEQHVVLFHRPLGVVAVITPWNFPISIAVRKIAPALLAGNTVVLKPSPYTPLTTLRLGQLLNKHLPAGVLNVISGSDPLGSWLTDHPGIRKITFTGSVRAGKSIFAAAANDVKRITLELGGNDPAIVLADANPKTAASRLFAGAFRNCGQLCMAPKRIYVEKALYRPLVDELASHARNAVIGDGRNPDTQIGPLSNQAQYSRVLGLMQTARADGATIHHGAQQLPTDGYFIAPGIVTGLEDGHPLVDEEQFGPILPVIAVDSAEAAIDRANRSHFGLGGSIWTTDTVRGAALARELECGVAWVNRHGDFNAEAPFGGMKWSGIGRENGSWGLAHFLEMQVVDIRPE